MPEQTLSPAAPGAFLIYRNAGLGLVLSYPSTWQTNEEASPVAFAAAFMAPYEGPQSPFRENVLFTVQPLLFPLALDNFVQFGMQGAQGRFQIASSAPALLSGISARQLTYSGSLNPQFMVPGKILTLFAVKGTRGYMFSYTARADRFDSYLPAVQQMIPSVIIL
jgi:hypothetical protein